MTEAERLAAELDAVPENGADPQLIEDAAAELRRLDDELTLCSQLKREYQEQAATAMVECEQLRADAERYRWMKQWVVQIPPGWERIGWDATIDAAMKEAKAHGWKFSKEAAAAMKEAK